MDFINESIMLNHIEAEEFGMPNPTFEVEDGIVPSADVVREGLRLYYGLTAGGMSEQDAGDGVAQFIYTGGMLEAHS